MTADKRTVTTDALETLGYLIGDKEARDAIHLAVEPIEAGCRLSPGQHVGIIDGKAHAVPLEDALGIVDPFLMGQVRAGERFWLLVYPRTITSLRHVWSHPAFADAESTHQGSGITRSASEAWMRAWAEKHVSDDYYGDGGKLPVQEAYEYALKAGYDNHIGPYEEAVAYIDDEWWMHWEAITGKAGKRDSYFSCAC